MSNMCLDSILLHPQLEPVTYCLQLRTQLNIWICFVLLFIIVVVVVIIFHTLFSELPTDSFIFFSHAIGLLKHHILQNNHKTKTSYHIKNLGKNK